MHWADWAAEYSSAPDSVVVACKSLEDDGFVAQDSSLADDDHVGIQGWEAIII